MDQEKVAEFIKKIREENHLTQKELADKYNVTYQAVSKWENAKNVPDISILKSMSKDFNVSLDDILEGQYSKKKISKKLITIGIIIAAVVMVSIFLIIKISDNDDFEFKTLSTTCNNFTISGNISYNRQKSAIYISNINYCGGNDNNNYQEIECTLYEYDNGKEIEISSYKYDGAESITLENFLKDVVFVVDNYNSVCKNYSKDSFKLMIKAKMEDKTIHYDIPLSLSDKCN